MREKKYIDRLYQEKFRDFEAVPREEVWNSISTKLQQGKRRRSIAPLWYRIAGVAAVLALILLLGDWFGTPQQANVVTSKEIEQPEKSNLPPSEENRVAATPEIQTENANISDSEKTGNETFVSTSSENRNEGAEKSLSVLSSISAEGQEQKNLGFETATQPLPQFETEKSIAEIAPIKKKSIFEELSKNEEVTEIEEDVLINKFEISTHAAPVFYGNLGEGNFLAPQFNNNETRAEVTYSYGVQLAYAISKNLKIRSGINKISMSYNTLNVAYRSVIRPNAINAINYPKEQPDLQTTGLAHDKLISSTSRARVGTLNGALLNQQLGYLEIPISLEYNIIDKKIGLNIIGGASTLFLEDNLVSVNSGNLTTALGQANNLNDVSFSTNIGFGLDYELTENFNLNLEPIFKYQISVFDSKLMDYQPFYMAIYTGLSFEF
ncbi:MAG TPA: hypothetical protein VFI78_02295 [Salinimicrobium sp.]|nr:hypothetical protein [Salinimicrobium sp.]